MALIRGTAFDDRLFGPPERNTIFGLEGDDVVFGNRFRDVMFGGPGDDDVFGRGGNDVYFGQDGDDFLQADFDIAPVMLGGSGNDILFGPDDTRSREKLFGGPGNDFLRGRAGDETIFGGSGNDDLVPDGGDDTLIGGPGFDTFDFDDTPPFTPAGVRVSIGNDLILDFRKGIDRIEFFFEGILTEFADLDSNGNGVLDGADARVDVSRGRTVIDLSDTFGDPVGTSTITVLGESRLTAADFEFN